jgi:hypothetical protein
LYSGFKNDSKVFEFICAAETVTLLEPIPGSCRVCALKIVNEATIMVISNIFFITFDLMDV